MPLSLLLFSSLLPLSLSLSPTLSLSSSPMPLSLLLPLSFSLSLPYTTQPTNIRNEEKKKTVSSNLIDRIFLQSVDFRVKFSTDIINAQMESVRREKKKNRIYHRIGRQETEKRKKKIQHSDNRHISRRFGFGQRYSFFFIFALIRLPINLFLLLYFHALHKVRTDTHIYTNYDA